LVGVQNLCSVAVGHCVFVVVREQVRDDGRLLRRVGGGVEPVILALDGLVIERPTRQRDAGPRVGHPEARPPHEVLDLGRAMAAKVAQRQLGHRLVAVQGTCLRYPFLQQRIGELLSAPRAADDHGVQLCAQQ